MKKVYILFCATLLLFNSFAATYYSQGSSTFNTFSNWNTIIGGGGTSPTAFNVANDIFIIQNGHTITTSGAIAFNATGSKIQIQNGGVLTATHLFTLLAIFQVDNGGTYNHNAAGSVANGVSTDFPGTTGAGRVFGATSNVNINAWAQATGTPVALPTIAAPGWGNLNINVPTWVGSLNMSGNFTAVQGNLDISSTGGQQFRLTGTTAANTTTIGGNLTINGGILGITSGTSTFAEVLNIGGNLIINAGTGQISNSSGNTNVSINVTGAISISGGATPAITSSAGTSYTVGNGITVSAGTFSLGTSSTHVTTLNVTGDINVNGTGSITNTASSNNTVTCTGNFNLSATGIYQMQNSSTASKTHILNIGGNFNMTGGTFTGGSNSSTGKVNFTGGASAVTYTQSGGIVTTSKNTDWTIAVGKTVTLNNDFNYLASSVVTTFTVNGTLNCSTNNLTGANNFVLGASGTLKIGSAAGISSTAATGSVQLTGTRTYPITANYEYNGSLAQVTGNQLPATVNALTINNAAGVSLTSTVATTSLALTSGKLTLGASNISANTVTNGSSSNYVITDGAGALKINGVGATNKLFPVGPSASGYNPITINNAGTSDNFSVKVKPTFTNTPFDATKVVNMEWTVGKDGAATGNNVSLTPQWNSGDEAASFTRASNVVIGHYGSVWDETAAANASGAGPFTTTASGFTSFSPFTVGNAGSFYNSTPPTVSLSSSNPSVSAGNLGQGIAKNNIYQFNLAVTLNAAILNSVSFTTGGTYAASDITKFQLWYNTSNNFGSAVQIGSDINSSLGTGAHSFVGLTQGIGIGITGYLWITTDVAASGVSTAGNTINVAAITSANIVFASATQSGTAYASDDQTIVVPSLTFSTANPAVSAASMGIGLSKNPIYNFTVASANAVAILTQLSFATGGTYAAADITRFQLWYNSTNSLSTATQLGVDITATLEAGAHSINSFAKNIGNGTTGYFWVTADIAGAATSGNTLFVSAITSSDLTFASGTISGAAFAGGVQTIITPSNAVDDFRSKISGDWAANSTWESAAAGSGSWHDATLAPTSAATSVTVQSGHTVSISSVVSSTNTTINNLGELDIASGGTLSFGATKTITVNGILKQIGTLTMGTSTFAIGSNGVYENAVAATTANILIPTATWTAGSTCKITGVVGTAAANPADYNLTSGIGQAFSNFVIDLPNLIGKYVLTNQATLVTAQFSATNLTVNSTGISTYGVQLTSSGKQEVISIGSYTQNGGIVSILHNSSNATAKALNVSGTFTLTGSSIFNISAYSTGTGQSTLSVGGNLTMSALSTLQKSIAFGTGGTAICLFNGSAAQTASFGITSGAVNYTLNNALGLTLSTSTTVNGILTLTTGTLTTGSNNLSLGSTASAVFNPASRLLISGGTTDFNNRPVTFKSDITGSASLGEITGTLSNATNVTVERYIRNNGFRSWRLLSVPTYGTQTINAAWQEGNTPMGNITPGYGTVISGTTTSLGFDAVSDYPGMLSFNGTNFVGIPRTTIPISTNKAYYLYVRGDRTEGVSSSTTANTSTILRTNGTLYQGTQTSDVIPADSYALIGNPYPSAIDFGAITRTGGVNNSFYIWDSKINGGTTLGGYQTFSETNSFQCPLPNGSFTQGAVNKTIQSGQAFFVETSGTSGTVSITESCKTASTGTTGYKLPGELVKIDSRLYSINATDTTMADANVVVFDSAYSNSVDGADASKFSNGGENLAIVRNGATLVIEGRNPVVVADTIFFKMWNMKPQAYQLEFVPQNLGAQSLTARLEDSYLNTSTPLDLSSNTLVDFTVNATPASYASNRFRIVFAPSLVLPVSFQSISASRKASNVQVNWKLGIETNVNRYEVERSTDGNKFNTVGIVAATGVSAYGFTDINAPASNLYYRIRSIGTAGEVKYSSMVKVGAENSKPSFAVVPNPVEGFMMNIQFGNQAKGIYQLRLVNAVGQQVTATSVSHLGGFGNHAISLPSSVARGTYQLEIIAPDRSSSFMKIFVNITL